MKGPRELFGSYIQNILILLSINILGKNQIIGCPQTWKKIAFQKLFYNLLLGDLECIFLWTYYYKQQLDSRGSPQVYSTHNKLETEHSQYKEFISRASMGKCLQSSGIIHQKHLLPGSTTWTPPHLLTCLKSAPSPKAARGIKGGIAGEDWLDPQDSPQPDEY